LFRSLNCFAFILLVHVTFELLLGIKLRAVFSLGDALSLPVLVIIVIILDDELNSWCLLDN